MYDTSSIRYQDKGNNKIEFSGTAGPVATPEADMTITFDNLTELPLEVRLNASGVNVSYDQLAIAQIEIPAPSVIGDIVEDNSVNFLIRYIKICLLNRKIFTMRNLLY